MIVLSYGMTKSGSTLAFELCKSVLQQKGFEQRRLPDGVVAPWHHINFVKDLNIATLQRVLAEVSRKEIITLKTHMPLPNEEKQFIEDKIARRKIKVHVNYRDPREICLSLLDAGVHAREAEKPAFAEIYTLGDAAKIVRRQLSVCRQWGSLRGALHLHYNDVAFNTRQAVDQMCADFGFRKFSDEDYGQLADRVFNEAFTQKNKAVKNRYKELSARQNQFLLKQIPEIGDFINRICIERDHGWFLMSEGTAS
jgi:hypothetical protein